MSNAPSRPKSPKKNHRITVRISASDLARLEASAKKRSMSAGAVVRSLIRTNLADSFANGGPVMRKLLLVIDDEPAVGRSICRVLARERGLDVEAITTAEEALRLIVAGCRPDAILCDVHLSGMSGVGFYNELLKLAPDLAPCLIFMSGDDASMEKGLPNSNPFLGKPFDLTILKSLVRALTAE
jgi:CheY-like chemotaxis protein